MVPSSSNSVAAANYCLVEERDLMASSTYAVVDPLLPFELMDGPVCCSIQQRDPASQMDLGVQLHRLAGFVCMRRHHISC